MQTVFHIHPPALGVDLAPCFRTFVSGGPLIVGAEPVMEKILAENFMGLPSTLKQSLSFPGPVHLRK